MAGPGRPRKTTEPADQRVPEIPQDVLDQFADAVDQEQDTIAAEQVRAGAPSIPGSGLFQPSDGKVILTNIRYPNQVIYRPTVRPDGKKEFNGQHPFEFIDGHLICTEAQAEFIKKQAPWVYIEPKEGDLFRHDATGFMSRSPQAMNEYNNKLSTHS